MTAITDFMHDTATAPQRVRSSPVQMLDGGRMMIRGSLSVLGAALIMSAVGLWIMPGSEFSSDVMLMKLCLSVGAVFLGIALTQGARTPKTPEVEIDTIRREIRLVRRTGKRFECIQSCKFVDLDRAEVHGAHVILWGPGDVMLAEVALRDPQLRRSLMGGLVDAGKL
jgi:hypothetical protein